MKYIARPKSDEEGLVRWLTDCLNTMEQVASSEDEEWTRVWHVGDVDDDIEDDHGDLIARPSFDARFTSYPRHIAMHNPRAVLARVQAERRVIAEYQEQVDYHGDPEGVLAARIAVQWLAWGHRFDIPGYDEALWTPKEEP